VFFFGCLFFVEMVGGFAQHPFMQVAVHMFICLPCRVQMDVVLALSELCDELGGRYLLFSCPAWPPVRGHWRGYCPARLPTTLVYFTDVLIPVGRGRLGPRPVLFFFLANKMYVWSQ
jgi:hypothetical protein